jgi:hypothetical protein
MIRPGSLARAWRCAQRLGKALEPATKTLGPIVAALWIAWQYHQSRIDKRVEATLAYVTQYESADSSVGKAQRSLTAALWVHSDEIAELRTTRASAVDLAKVQMTIAKRVIDTAGAGFGKSSVVGPLDELDDFYNALGTCIQGNVCDEASALRFFGCAAIDLVDDFGAAMDARDKLASRFGWGVRLIATRAQETKSCQA